LEGSVKVRKVLEENLAEGEKKAPFMKSDPHGKQFLGSEKGTRGKTTPSTRHRVKKKTKAQKQRGCLEPYFLAKGKRSRGEGEESAHVTRGKQGRLRR